LLAFSPNTPQNYQQHHINSVDEDSETKQQLLGPVVVFYHSIHSLQRQKKEATATATMVAGVK